MRVRQLTLSWLMLLSLSVPTLSWAVDRYAVASGGATTGSCPIGTPCTLARGLSLTVAGDVLNLRAGNYGAINCGTQTWNSGTGTGNEAPGAPWPNAVTIRNFPGETVWIAGEVFGNAIGCNSPGYSYIIFDGLHIDGTLAGIQDGYAMQGGPHHIRYQNAEIKNVGQHPNFSSCTPGGDPCAMGISSHYDGSNDTHHIEFINLHVHHNGIAHQGDHGFYIATRNMLIENCDIHNNSGSGIQVYQGDCGSGTCANNTIIRNNRVYDNTGNIGAMTISHGQNIQIYNNVIWDNSSGINVAYSNNGTKVYNNTIYGNTNTGIDVAAESINAVIRNNIIYNNGWPIATDVAPSTTGAANLCNSTGGLCTHQGNPGFIFAAGGDFHIGAAGSPAVGVGINLTSAGITTDAEGLARPATDAWDLGAYVFAAAPNPSVGLIGKYPFEEGSGTTAADASGLGHTCTLNTAGWGPGIIGSFSFLLEGTKRCVVTGTSTLRPTATMGIVAWINTTNANHQYIADMGGAYGLRLTDTGALRVFASTTAGFVGLSSSGVDLRTGTNRHVATTKDATGLRLWVDGVQVGFAATTAAISYTGTENLFIGRNGFTDQEYFVGRIDQIYIYDTPLTLTDVTSLMNEAQPSAGTTMPNMGWTVANQTEATSLAQVNNNVSHLITLPIGFRAGIHHLGAQMTEFFPPTCRMFRQSLGVWSAWTAVTNNFGSLGIRLATDSAVTMGQLTTQTLLPVGVGFTSVQGRFVVATLNTSVQTTLGDAQRTEWETRLEFGAPLVAGDLVQCRHNRESGAAFDAYGPSAPPDSFSTLTLQGLSPPSSVRVGGLMQGGVTR